MREWYYNAYGYLPDQYELIEWLVEDDYEEKDLVEFDREELLELYWLDHSQN